MNGYSRSSPDLFMRFSNGTLQYQLQAIKEDATLTVVNGRVQGDKLHANPFSFTKTRLCYPSGSRRFYEVWGGGYDYLETGSFSGSLSIPYDTPIDRRAVAYNKALSKFYQAVRQSELNLATTLGESPESIRMFKQFLTGILTVKRGVRRALRRPDLALSGAWLVNQYGIKPALSDIYAWADYCRDVGEHAVTPVKVRGGAKGSAYYNKSSWPPASSKTSYSQRVEIAGSYTVSNRELFEVSRLSSLNPVALAWELTPLSFVVDWFVDIGGYLENFEAAFGIGLSFVTGYVTDTSLLDVRGAWYGDRPKPSSGYAEYFIYAPYSYQRKTLNRVCLTQFPRPEFPRLDIHLGSSRLLSAAALLNSLFLRRS